MKPRHLILATLFSSIALFSGLAHSQAAKDASISATFYTGDLKLSYSMFGKGASGGAALRKMYDAGQWTELVKGVIEKKFVVDTYYFYLGRAAEELGYPDAALKYYAAVINASNMETCTGIINNCAGFTFPKDAVSRKEALFLNKMPPGRSWPLGEGPLLSTYPLPAAESIEVAAQASSSTNTTSARGKFESEEDYQKRAQLPSTRFIVIPVPTDNEARCKTSYNHGSSTYSIQQCNIISSTIPVTRNTVEGKPLILANAYDRREIKRRETNTYRMDAAFTWSADYKIAPNDAAALDTDLLLGIEVQGLSSGKICDLCQSRNYNDTLSSMASSLATLSGSRQPVENNWKDDAFRTGVIDEDWNYTLRPAKVIRYIVFRKSDQRILFERSAN